ncbi:acyltransferase [Jatrophihabitans telluris]|uniref:Acyltransferase n=1 Tax=Jatrophihabitans telluris TaxID=2038343 RepID=A0ABY4QZ95_9ACTN|nr:acyltransferase [Jatrophihabitans telluris]UQX88186.1 acyltransferase [Jatrophihabitans telluris]
MQSAPRLTVADQRWVTSRVLSDVFSGRSNSLGFLRWVFATLVVVDHSFPIGGFNGGVDPTWKWSRSQDSLGGIAVGGFFVVSGFLVTRSWFTSRGTLRFLWRRFLRIFPGFWVCLIVTAFLLAPIAWRHERGGLTGVYSVGQDSVWHYISANFWLTMHQYNIAGLFTHTPYGRTGYPAAWDGSLWTLIYEFKCYLFLAVLGLVGLLRYRRVVLGLTAASYALMLSWLIDPAWASKLLPMLSDVYVARFLFLFLLGSTIAFYADSLLIDDRIGILAVLLGLYSLHHGGWLLIGYPCLAYAIVWLAIRLPLQGFERIGDLSYGTYIYAFPLQMLLAEYGLQRHGPAIFVLASIALAGVAALLSWHLVEKHALRLKNARLSLPRRRRPEPVEHLLGELDDPGQDTRQTPDPVPHKLGV